MIVKVQRSVYSTCGPMLLVYNEDNSMRGQWVLNDEWGARFTDNGDLRDFKFFAEVDWVGDARLPRFIGYAPEQEW
jgi:hypothetical protein